MIVPMCRYERWWSLRLAICDAVLDADSVRFQQQEVQQDKAVVRFNKHVMVDTKGACLDNKEEIRGVDEDNGRGVVVQPTAGWVAW